MGIYVHLPFCPYVCPYCDFAKWRFDEAASRRYLVALEAEIAAAPAFADRDDRGHRDWHAERDHRDWHDRGYYAPPVVVSPPAYGYYAPPPVAYGPPGVSIGINLP